MSPLFNDTISLDAVIEFGVASTLGSHGKQWIIFALLALYTLK